MVSRLRTGDGAKPSSTSTSKQESGLADGYRRARLPLPPAWLDGRLGRHRPPPTVGKGSIGVITIDLPGRGELFEHPFAIAGDPDADMSSVGAAASPVNLGPGDSHKRLVTLRDANGTPVPLPERADDSSRWQHHDRRHRWLL